MNRIIFCSKSSKTAHLLAQDGQNLSKDKYISYDELLDKYYLSYDEQTIAYLISAYNYNYDSALLILKTIVYLDDKSYDNEKIKQLNNLKKELLGKDLLKQDSLFKEYLKRYDLYYEDDYLDKFLINTLDEIGASKIKRETANYPLAKLALFDNLALETEHLYQSISKLLIDGVDAKDIKILGLSSSYEKDIQRLSSVFGIRISIFRTSFSSYRFSKDYLSLLDKTNSFQEALDRLKEKYPSNKSKYTSFYNHLLRVINKVNILDASFDTKKEIFLTLLKKTSFDESYEQEIDSLDLFNLSCRTDDHIFIVGINQNILPAIYKDEDYLSDEDKKLLNYELSSEKTKRAKDIFKNLIASYKHIYLSANLYAGDGPRTLSSLIAEMGIEVIENPDFDKVYNPKLASLRLTRYLDDYIKYDVKDKNLESYYAAIKIPYQTYSNKFKGIDKEKLAAYIGDKLVLSYSSLNEFNDCAFRYYLSHILKLNKYEETFHTIIGNIFHAVLAELVKGNKDIDALWQRELAKHKFTSSEKILLVKMKEELYLIAKQVEAFHANSDFKNLYAEERFEIALDERTTFKGFIDKLMYHSLGDDTLVALLDYKTGSVDVKLKNLDFGFDMQLPVYWYLLKKSGLFKNPKFTGMYLQRILFDEQTLKPDEDEEEIKLERLKLNGYSSLEPNRVLKLDPFDKSSDYIQGLRLTNAGELAKSSKHLSDMDVDDVYKKVETFIEDAKERIWDGDFQINPKYFDNKLQSCKYCPFRDICFKTEEDIVYLERGDDNADLD